VTVVPHGIDPARFPLGLEKRRQIAFMPRKHADEAQAVFGWLHARGALGGWTVVPIDGLSEAETSRVLQDSLVFFAFGYPEGGTLPPFEAMATGCVVIGYGGFASDALLEQCGGDGVPSGDTGTFARVADATLRMPEEMLVLWGQDSRDRVLRTFPMTGERDALLSVMTPRVAGVAA